LPAPPAASASELLSIVSVPKLRAKPSDVVAAHVLVPGS
jgi:hypothetical protein